MQHERLRDAWSVRKRTVPISPELHFAPDGSSWGTERFCFRPKGTAGAVFDGEMSLRFGDVLQPTDPLIVTYRLFREALLATSVIWQPLWAYVSAFTTDYWKGPIVAGAPVIRHNPFFIPWIAYLSPAVTRGFVVEPDLRTESTADGGLLMSATNERLDLANPEHLRRARILAETMIARTGHKFPNDNPD